MKLNWFSPLSPARTDVAHFTQRLLPALSSLAEVTLWTEQRVWDPGLAELATIRTFREGRIPLADINRADMSFYQIGNNPLFHGAAWQLSRQHPGVVVLHDFRLHHFFDGLYRVKWRDRNSYLEVMERYYGSQGRKDAADCYRSEARNIEYMAEHYPLTSLAIENALGVMVHNRSSYESLAKDLLSPLIYVPLPFAAKPGGLRRDSKRQAGSVDLPFRLILFGYIGRNRRLESVLQALAGLPEKDMFHLDIVGEILDDKKHVQSQVSSLNLKNHVTFHGFTTEAKLDTLLSGSDLAINLRFPTVGEASGSQLRIWAHALPSLVTQIGWYESLPPETVAFVRSGEHEIQDIQRHLRALAAKPEDFARLGEKGREELEKYHTPEAYARAVIEMAETAKLFRSRKAYLSLAERSARQANKWIPGTKAEQVFRRVAGEILALTKR